MHRRNPAAWAVALLAVLAAAWPECSSEPPPPAPRPLTADEIALRNELGIPLDAQTVVVFQQAAHLDIDWQKTFDDYYTSYVDDIFTRARKILDTQPRAFYTVTEMAYLQHHVETHPDELAPLQAAAARGALHIVGGGMTSPDTVLPETELLARDFLYGIQFAEDTIGAHPTAAYLPDSFGHAATAPDILAAAGYDSVAFSRIDGAPTLFQWLFHADSEPTPGSTAETLKKLGSADFVWQGTGGAKVLAHFMSGPALYCEGDNIDYQEKLQTPGGHLGAFAGDDTSYTDGQIDGYVATARPWARTPYIFIPVGCDFEPPKERLVEYLDGYDQRRYPTTHVWAVAAPFDDYARFVRAYEDLLPEVDGTLTPYFTGFYGTRPAVKRATRDAARPFFEAETFATALGDEGRTLVAAQAPALRKLTRADHHDFITGTSNDEVVTTEQMPLLAEAQAAGQASLEQVVAALAKRIPLEPQGVGRALALNASSALRSGVAHLTVPISAGATPDLHAIAAGEPVPMELARTPGPKDTTATFRLALAAVRPFSWRTVTLLPGAVAPQRQVTLETLDASDAPASGQAVSHVILKNAHVHAEWRKDGSGRFSLTSLLVDGAQAIAGSSVLFHDYTDTGGLWRLGNEMLGCELTAKVGDSGAPDTLEVLDDGALEVRVAFHTGAVTREASLGAGDTGLDIAVTTNAAEGTTRTVGFSLAVPPDAKLQTSLAGGYAERPLEALYSPTFWPAVAWVRAGDWAIALRQSTGVRMSTPGELELMAARDARGEKCEVEGGTGSDPDLHRIEWRIEHAPSPADAARAAQAFDRPLTLAMVDASQAQTTDLPEERSLLQVDGDGIVTALKPAERGSGLIVRAVLLPGPVVVRGLAGKKVTAVDLAERDLRSMGTAGDGLVLDAGELGSIASVRVE